MSFAVVHSRALDALEAQPVTVEVHLANGLPSFTLVGLADTEVKESRERVRAALLQSGFAFPHNKRITVNLAPADLPKESGRFDLPIALGILAAAGQIDPQRLGGFEFAGELSLAGELRPVRGALALALAVRRADGQRCLVLPADSAQAAARVGGLDIRAAEQPAAGGAVAAAGRGRAAAAASPGAAASADAGRGRPARREGPGRCQARAGDRRRRRAQPAVHRPARHRQVDAGAAPGRHPAADGRGRGAGQRRAAGPGHAGLRSARLRPAAVRSPHHSASAVALVGGGSPPRPGEISLAHGGVLFLDELPEFPRAALEALREPLESGHITISRAARQAAFPARFQLVAAMNPCPCGYLGAFAATGKTCRCTPDGIARYRTRLSGPLLDRIDLQVEVHAVKPEALMAQADGERSAAVALRVAAARQRQMQRQGMPNAAIDAGTHRCAVRAGRSGRTLRAEPRRSG